MRKGRRPQATILVEKRRKGNERTNQVYLDPKQNEIDYLNKFMGRIFFWSFTISPIKPYDHASKFRVTTHRYIPRHILFPNLHKHLPEDSKIVLVSGYKYRHTFDVRTSQSMRWDDFILRTVNALEGAL